MLRFAAIFVLCVALAVPCAAWENPFEREPDTNHYTWDKSRGELRGYNPQTGRSWVNNYDRYGSQSGLDSNGNYWKYDNSTGIYYNYGTKEIRVRPKPKPWE